MGQSAGVEYLFTHAMDEDQIEATHHYYPESDDGEETETESAYAGRPSATIRRTRRISCNSSSSRNVDIAMKQRNSHDTSAARQRSPTKTRSRRTSSDDLVVGADAHTASLGLHRSFSLASVHHFLVDSVYSATSALVGSATSMSSSSTGRVATAAGGGEVASWTPSSSAFAGSGSRSNNDEEHGSWLTDRHNTNAYPHVHRSHSASDLPSTFLSAVSPSLASGDFDFPDATAAAAGATGEQQEEYARAISYWRRILRSLSFQ